MAEAALAKGQPVLEKKPVKFSNLLLGAGLNMFEVTTLGQVRATTRTIHIFEDGKLTWA